MGATPVPAFPVKIQSAPYNKLVTIGVRSALRSNLTYSSHRATFEKPAVFFNLSMLRNVSCFQSYQERFFNVKNQGDPIRSTWELDWWTKPFRIKWLWIRWDFIFLPGSICSRWAKDGKFRRCTVWYTATTTWAWHYIESFARNFLNGNVIWSRGWVRPLKEEMVIVIKKHGAAESFASVFPSLLVFRLSLAQPWHFQKLFEAWVT